MEATNAVKAFTTFLGVDPGETTGWALTGVHMVPIIPTGKAAFMGEAHGLDELIDFLESLNPKPDIIIFERYVVTRLDTDINTGEHETIQAIGVIKSYARRNGIPIVGQLRTVKPQGYAWHHTIRTPGAKANSHRRDAHAHVCYYQTTHKNPETGKPYYVLKRR